MSTIIDDGSPKGSLTPDERNWGMFCHLAAFLGFVIPFGNLIGPLIIWMLKKEEYAFVDYNGKEVLNFQITVLIALLVSWLLVFIFIGLLILPIVIIAAMVLMVIGAIKTSKGEYYRYPLTIRFLS